MCGIHLILDSKPSGESRIQKMLAASHHRGPNQSGFEQIGGNIWVGANRLKILDLSEKASLPMKSVDGRFILTWNGAIYNYLELREQLIKAGYSFQTQSDTEVLFNWLKVHGEKGLERLNGMFSLVFIDLEKREILFARDPTGQKPLHYFKEGKDWVFSSESRGVLAGLESQPEIDTNQFLPYSYYRFSWPDSSFFENVRQMLPGEVLVLDFEGNLRRQTSIDFRKSFSNEAPNWESELRKSILRSFQSDRQAGMILSGGVDSSLIYALWYEQTATKLPTFTVHFQENFTNDFSDYKYAQLLSKRYPSQFEGIRVTKEILMSNWQEYVRSMDQPVGDGAGFLTWYIAKKIHSEVKVLISGAGADELFGGYNRHKAFLQYLKNPTLTALGGRILGTLGMKAAQKFSASLEKSPTDTFIQMAALHPIPKECLGEFAKYYPEQHGDLKRALGFDRQFYLVNDILKIHDNACMAHGIEGRAPYLDWNLIAYANGLSEQELRKNMGKKNLKSMLNARGLEAISKRKKLGFGMPIREWMDDGDFREFIFRPINEMESTWGNQFNSEIRTLMRKPESFIETNILLIWNWFVLATWLQKHPK